ncbi:MAG: T9SS type A sorting domain-containing protein [Ginsengibacter sp.]
MKRFLYIFLVLAGFQFNANAQVTPVHVVTDAVKTIKFYPNPAVNFINFEFSKSYDNSYTLVIFNFIGKKIEDIKVNDQKITVSLSGFYRGVYVFQLRDQQGSIVESGKFQVTK